MKVQTDIWYRKILKYVTCVTLWKNFGHRSVTFTFQEFPVKGVHIYMYNCRSGGPLSQYVPSADKKRVFLNFLSTILLWKLLLCSNLAYVSLEIKYYLLACLPYLYYTVSYLITISNSNWTKWSTIQGVIPLASYADILWARHAIFLPHERLLKRMGTFLTLDQPESTWRSPKSQSTLGYCSIESQS